MSVPFDTKLVPDTHEALLSNLILFGRLLRTLGLDISPDHMVTVCQALFHINIGQRQDFYYALQSLLVNQQSELPLFEQAFRLFWRKPVARLAWEEVLTFSQEKEKSAQVMPASLPLPHPMPESPTSMAEESQTLIEVARTYSDHEWLYQKDFAELTPKETKQIKQLMANMVWHIEPRRTRRQRRKGKRQLDLRRLVRHNLRYGGELLTLPQQQPKVKPRPLVIVADVSGSMERYTRLLLHFTYGLTRSLQQRVEAFVFSTRLTHITRPLHHRHIDQALLEVAQAVPDWSGGTRIGEAIKRFNYDWGRRVLQGGAIVLLISDGWDRGDPALLGQEMARLQRSCHRLIWLNPLLGSPNYEPLTRGMVAALPFTDDFLPVHNLASLAQLAHHLQNLES